MDVKQYSIAYEIIDVIFSVLFLPRVHDWLRAQLGSAPQRHIKVRHPVLWGRRGESGMVVAQDANWSNNQTKELFTIVSCKRLWVFRGENAYKNVFTKQG